MSRKNLPLLLLGSVAGSSSTLDPIHTTFLDGAMGAGEVGEDMEAGLLQQSLCVRNMQAHRTTAQAISLDHTSLVKCFSPSF